MKRFLFILLIGFSAISNGQNNKLFDEANTLYNKGNYQEAIDNYLKITKGGEHSASLYYNLGNAYYKQNQIASSIYYYEKALLLSPNDEDIKNNLLFAQNMTVDAIEMMPQTGLTKLVENSLGNLSYNTWGTLAIALMFLFVFTFLMYYFSPYQNRKRLFFVISLMALVLSIASVSFAYHQFGQVQNQNPAIIFAKEATVKSEPNNRSEDVFLLHEGTKINVMDTMGEWKKIKLTDGKIGWLPSDDLKELKEF